MGGRQKSAVEQVSVRTEGAEQSADPQLRKSFCTGKGVLGVFSYFEPHSLPSTNSVCAEGARLWEFSQSLPGKQQDGGSWALPGAPGKANMGALGRAPVTPRALGHRPRRTRFPSGRGEGGCSVGSQSRHQCYKAHPLGGVGKGGIAGWALRRKE